MSSEQIRRLRTLSANIVSGNLRVDPEYLIMWVAEVNQILTELIADDSDEETYDNN